MAVFLTSRLGIHRWTDDDDPWDREDWDGDNVKLEALAIIGTQGANSGRPAAGVQRRLYLADDVERLYIDDGDEWLEVGLLATGNAWTGLQTFDGGIGVTDGTLEVTGNLAVSGSVSAGGVTLATTTALTNHINNATGAHAASAIAVTPTGDVAATDVQAAIAELSSEKATAASLTAHTSAAAGAHAATAIANTPAGNVAATTVQAAINELDTEKAPTVSPTITGTATLNAAIAHTGTLVGFYSTTPVARPGTYNLTGSADRTLGAYASDPESSAYTGTPADAASTAKLADLNALRTAYENLRVYVEDLAGLTIGTATDLKTLGLFG